VAEEKKDRRRGLRKAARLATRFWNDEIEATCFTRDLSASGVFLATREPLVVRSRLHLEFELSSGPFFTEGVVVRVVEEPTTEQSVVERGVGIRVISLLEEFHQTTAHNATGAQPLELDLTDSHVLLTTFVRDIKRGGLMVLTEDLPEPHATVNIRIKLAPPQPDIHAKGVVIHRLSQPSAVGLQLLDIDELREKLAKAIME
jgi:hypothetical protein